MIAVDTNILVYAHRADADWHDRAKNCIAELANGNVSWGLPWHCLSEFFAIVTHPRVYKPASTTANAIEQIDAWLESPVSQCLSETDGYWQNLRSFLIDGRIEGPMVYDARIAAICSVHGVVELWSADRDFSRFPGLKVHNPLL